MKIKTTKTTIILLGILVLFVLIAAVQHYNEKRYNSVLREGRERVNIDIYDDSGLKVKSISCVTIDTVARNVFDSSLAVTYTDWTEEGGRELHFIKIPKTFILNSWIEE